MTVAQIVLAILGSASVAAVAGAVVSGMFSRKKLGAEATEIIARAASGVVERVESENARLRQVVDKMRADREDMAEILSEHTAVLQLHASWDAMAVAKLREAGIIDLPEPPPVYHPHVRPSIVSRILETRAEEEKRILEEGK